MQNKVKHVPGKNRYILEAMKVSQNESTDKSHPTGAVVVKKGKILGGGANQSKLKNRKLIELHARGWCVRRKLKIKSGAKYWLCPGCSFPQNHAEGEAVRNAIKNVGAEAVKGADLYLYGHWWCCDVCWDNMNNAGISNVYLVNPKK